MQLVVLKQFLKSFRASSHPLLPENRVYEFFLAQPKKLINPAFGRGGRALFAALVRIILKYILLLIHLNLKLMAMEILSPFAAKLLFPFLIQQNLQKSLRQPVCRTKSTNQSSKVFAKLFA